MSANLNKDKTKVCIVCKIRKPLSNFIVTDISHNVKKYSDICNACRIKASRRWKKNLLLQEDNTEEGGGGKINSETIDSNVKDHIKKKEKKEKDAFEEEKQEAREDFDEEEQAKLAEKELAAYLAHKRQKFLEAQRLEAEKSNKPKGRREGAKKWEKTATGLYAGSKATEALLREQRRLAALGRTRLATTSPQRSGLFNKANQVDQKQQAKTSLNFTDIDPALQSTSSLEATQAKNRLFSARVLNERAISGGFREQEQKRLRFSNKQQEESSKTDELTPAFSKGS